MIQYRGLLGSSFVSSETPVIVRFKHSRKGEFEDLASARAWLEKARSAHRSGADAAHIFIFQNGKWKLTKD
jgi:hypothetical protein